MPISMLCWLRLWLLATTVAIAVQGYTVPKVQFEYLTPRGFRASIPDSPGLQLFAFHARINKLFRQFEEGDFAGDILEASDGSWSYANPRAVIQEGDVIHYWVYVQFEGNSYWLKDQRHTVVGRADKKQKTTVSPVTSTVATTTAAPVCQSTPTTVNGQPSCAGKLIFEDNFDNLDTAKWQREIRIPLDTESAEFVSYQSLPENAYTAGGRLFIVPTQLGMSPGFNDERIRTGELKLDGCKSPTGNQYECQRKAALSAILPPILSAKLNTKHSFRFRYGRIEVRAKLPKGDWIFPQILLQPYENFYGYADHASGMLLVAHILSNEMLRAADGAQLDGHRLRGGAIVSNTAPHREYFLRSNVLDDHFGDQYHVYGLQWTPDNILLTVDGFQYGALRRSFKEYGHGQNLTQANLWNVANILSPFDRELYISLGVGVGGVKDFPDQSRTGLSGTVKPWNNTSPKAEYHFYQSRNAWYRTWTEPELMVDYVRVYAL